MKVLFLDFDGVINSVRSSAAFGGYPWNINEESLKLFDEVGLLLIRNLCDANDIKIVVSSTWRKCFTHESLATALDLPIIGATPHKLSHQRRGEEIQEWLDNHKEVKKYVILDDDGDMLEHQMCRFVQTCPYDGLRWSDYNKIKELFGIK